jgi:dihydroxyacid dehydratase/phosphogluconate dehydratase
MTMGTASTLATMVEAMSMALPDNAVLLAAYYAETERSQERFQPDPN